MKHPLDLVDAQEAGVVGFATVDDKGRVSLAKPVRQALGVRPGSALAFVLVDGMLLLIPQDEQLAALMDHAASVLERAGVTVEALLEELPAVRGEIMRETYGDEFVDALARQWETSRGREPEADTPRGA